jgi:methionyl aminopeptidase
MNKEDIAKLKKAGSIASKVVEFSRSFIKPQMPLIEIAEKIEDQIKSLDAKPAFPVNLSINEIAAHATPSHSSEEIAHGLLKVDIGIHLSGFIADTAFTLDLENSQENQSLIQATQSALKIATGSISINSTLSQIGETIENEIKSKGCLPVSNLSGHSIDKYNLHSGITIPNYNNSSDLQLKPGLYAIEPFATLSSATGSVRDGKPSGIYRIDSNAQPRDSLAREILQFINEEYSTLPFCSRWIVKKFGSRSLISLNQMEQSKILHHYKQLIERSGNKVAQAEHTILLLPNEKIITTL